MTRTPPTIPGLKTFDLSKLKQPWRTDTEKRWGKETAADASIRITLEKTKCLDATEVKSFTDALGTLPTEAESVHMLIGQRHSMGHALPAILNLSKCTITDLYISTLTFSKSNATDWAALVEEGKIKNLLVICSAYFQKTSPQIFDFGKAIFDSRNIRLLPIRCHAKIIAATLDDGRTITAEGSANTRSCKTIEQLTITGNGQVFAFHRQWMESQWASRNTT